MIKRRLSLTFIIIGFLIGVYFGVSTISAELENDPALVMYFPFDVNLTDATNRSYSYNSETVYASVVAGGEVYWTTSGRKGGAVFLEGKDDKDTLVSNAILPLPEDADFTVVLWAKRAETTTVDALFNWMTTGSTIYREAYFDDKGDIIFRLRNGSSTVFTVAQADSIAKEWVHVAFVRNGKAMRVYKNGVKQAASNETKYDGILGAPTGPLRIGRTAFGSPFNGTLDEFMLFSRALSDSEISNIYNSYSGTGAVCGNGIKETGEECDSSDLSGQTCTSKGFASGTLGCYAAGGANQCTFDSSSCVATTSSCSDGVKSPGEADVDCGGSCTAKCSNGQSCNVAADCSSGNCEGNICKTRSISGSTKYYYRVKAINSYGSSTYSNEAFIDLTPSCTLTGAYWNTVDAVDGDTVQLVVEGTNCASEQVSFEIIEKDRFSGNDYPLTQPTGNFAFIDGKASATWTAEYQSDEWGSDPEYYFVATVAGKAISIDNSANTLHVSESACTDCAPYIELPVSLGSISLIPGNIKNVVFEFNVRGNVANILSNTATGKFSKGSVEKTNSSCLSVSSSSSMKKFKCTIPMQYYESAGEWNIDVAINDNLGATLRNNTEKFIVEELKDISLSSKSVSFPTIKTGAKDISSVPLIIKNNGNYGNSVKVTAHNLHGLDNRNEFIAASLFKISTASDACISGISASNGTEITLTGSPLAAGSSSSKNIYYCLTSVPAISSQEYSTLPGYGWKIGLA